MHLLADVIQHSTPFKFFTCENALPKSVIDALSAMFNEDHDWEIHDSFYKASIADVSQELEPEFLIQLADRMAEITGTKLSGRVEVKIQKMDVGQFSGVHTDRPLMGYEAIRLVVQLNEEWSGERDGGALRIHDADDDMGVFLERTPIKNSCFGFVMTPEAHHSVQVTNRERRSAVFYLWHVGNTQVISDWVDGQFSGVNFADLPDYLSDKIVLAEQHQTEEATFRAAVVAWLLLQWGCDRECVTNGYQSSLQCHSVASTKEELMASWVFRLKYEAFDVEQWRVMRQIFVGRHHFANQSVQEAVRVCLEGNAN